jgi:hypothetical protein
MKSDLYTKIVLTIIAIMLGVIAWSRYVGSGPVTQIQAAPFAEVQFLANSNGEMAGAIDTRTGDYWTLYNSSCGSKYAKLEGGPGKWSYYGKISKLGDPIVGWAERCESDPGANIPAK